MQRKHRIDMLMTRGGLSIFILSCALVWSGSTACAQDANLGDLARKVRTDHARQGTATSTEARRLAEELEQAQEEATAAPPGYMSYNAGEYRLWLLAPSDIEGRDNNGTLLAASPASGAKMMVFAGNPIPLNGPGTEATLHDIAVKFATQYNGANSGVECWKRKTKVHLSYGCSISTVLGKTVWGTGMFVMGSSSVMPVMCVDPEQATEQLVYGNPNASYKEKQIAYAKQARRFESERTTARVCETIYDSVELKEDREPRPVTVDGKAKVIRRGAPAVPPQPPSVLPVSVVQTEPAAPSLADIAREHKQESQRQPKAVRDVEDVAELRTAAKEFKNYSFVYCKEQGQCWDASLLIPENATLLTSDYEQYVFEAPLGDNPVLLFVGPEGGFGRVINGNAHTNTVGWVEFSHPEGYADTPQGQTFTPKASIVDGKDAVAVRFHLFKSLKNWIGEKVAVKTHDMNILAGCIAPEDRWSDAQAVCSTLIDSLRLP